MFIAVYFADKDAEIRSMVINLDRVITIDHAHIAGNHLVNNTHIHLTNRRRITVNHPNGDAMQVCESMEGAAKWISMALNGKIFSFDVLSERDLGGMDQRLYEGQ